MSRFFLNLINMACVFAQVPPGIVGGLHERSVAAFDFEVLLHPPEQTGDEATQGVEGVAKIELIQKNADTQASINEKLRLINAEKKELRRIVQSAFSK